LGGGYSSLCIAGDRLYTLVTRGGRESVVCLNASTGKEQWLTPVTATYIDGQRQGAGPRATPTYEGGKLYCLFPAGDLVCVDTGGGRIEWRANILEATGAGTHGNLTYYWGMSASPLVEGELVIVQPGGRQNNSVAAFDKQSGKLVWKVGSDPPGYGSPIAVATHGRRHIIAVTGSSVVSVEPKSGDLLWRYEWGNQYNCNCATPLWVDRSLFVSSAYGTGCTRLETAGSGSKTGVTEVWRNRDLQNQFATSMVIDGSIYGPHGDLGGITFRCLDWKTGKLNWAARGPGKCSLIAVEKHLICVSETGTITLVKADPSEYVEQGTLDGLLTRKAWPPPALSRRRLYVRDESDLVCVDLRE
jgi:outer membrane protein assembly factor BamB